MKYTDEYLQNPFKNTESDPGVDREKYENEILYDIPCEKEFRVESTSALLELIETIKGDKAMKKIHLPPMDLRIGEGQYALNVSGLDNAVFEGGSVHVRDFTGGLAFRNCKNICFRNMRFTYDVPMYASGKVIGCSEKGVTIRLYDNYTTDVFRRDDENDHAIYNSLFEKELIAEYLEYEEDTNIPREKGNFLYNNYNEGSVGPKLAIKSHRIIDNQIVEIEFGHSIRHPPEGTSVSMAFTMYQCPGILFEECEEIYLENFEINQVPGMAINFTTCRNIHINRIQIKSDLENNKFQTLTADGLHIKNCMGKVSVRNSLLEASHDDAVNIAGMYLEVFKAMPGKALVRAHLGMWATHVPKAGDILEVTAAQSLALKQNIQLESVQVSEDYVEIGFDETIELEQGDFLADLNNVASLDFVNNIIRNKRNRGLLLQTRDVVVRDNYFSHVLHGAILMVCEVYNFCESISVKNMLIEQNKFYKCNEFTNADIEVTAFVDEDKSPEQPVMEDITIRNNLMAESGNCGVYINSGKNISISDNIIYRPSRTPLADINRHAVVVMNSEQISMKDNQYILRETEGYEKIKVVK